MTFAENFKRVIKGQGYTLAKKVGRSPQTVYSAIRKGTVSVPILKSYADAVGVPVYRLLMTPEDEAVLTKVGFRCPKCGQRFILAPID